MKTLNFFFLISFLLFLLEALAGYFSHSLSLLSDSLHLLSDNLSLLLSFFALKFEKRPSSLKATFGYQKLGLLFTLFNGLFLVLSSLYILYEAIERLKSPNPINLKIMLPVAIVGLSGNVLMLLILRRHHEDIHWKSAWLHILGDTLEERLRSKGITHVVLQMEATSCEEKGERCHHEFYAGG